MSEDNPETKPVEPANGGAGATVGSGKSGLAKHWSRFFVFLPYLGAAVLAFMGLGLASVLVAGLFQHDSIVRDLASPDLARGVITFIFAIGTIGIALLVTIGALVGGSNEQQLLKAKEVLTVLIGVFGTILGFYFGAASGGAQKLDIAEIRIADKQLMTHVAGGTPPYRYSITSSEKDFTPVTDQVSKDGWIVQPLTTIPKAGTIIVDVLDGRDLKGARERKLSPETPSPTPSPSTSATTTQTSPHQ